MNFSELNNLTTVTLALQALAEVTEAIEQIKLHLEFPNEQDAEWRKRAEYALKKRGGIKVAITARLAVLRQQEKERNLAMHQHHNDYMVRELMKYVPDTVVKICNARAKIKAEAANGY